VSPGVRRTALFVAFCTLVVCARVIGSASFELKTARALEAEQRWHQAAAGYGAAIRMYLPGLPVGAAASERLLALADRAEASGDPAEVRFCLEELRSGWLAVRSLYQPGQSWVADAEARLAALMLEDPRARWPDRSLTPAQRAQIVHATLDERGDPSAAWVVVMGLGYLLWLASAAMALWTGIPAGPDAPMRWKRLGQWAGASVGGYLVWLIALRFA